MVRKEGLVITISISCFVLAFIMPGFLFVTGTSNARQFSRTAKKWNSYNDEYDAYHDNHECCQVDDVEQYNVRVADYPGLNTKNWFKKICQSDVFLGLTPWEALSAVCRDPGFSGVVATVFLCNDDELLSAENEKGAAVKTYFARLSKLFSKVSQVEKIKAVILTTALFRQEDFENEEYLQKKIDFNAKLMADNSAAERHTIVAQARGRAPHVVKHVMLDMATILPTADMYEDMYYCKREIPPLRWKSHTAIHLNKICMKKVLKEFIRIKKALEKGWRRGHRGGQTRPRVQGTGAIP